MPNSRLLKQVSELSIDPDLKQALLKSVSDNQRLKNEMTAFQQSAKTVLENNSFVETARAIFDHCCEMTGASSGYVALLSDTGEENEVLFLEAGDLPCDVDPELPMPIRGLREVAYRENRTVYDNDFMSSNWVEFMPEGHVVLNNVMFAPLILAGKTVGIMGLANKASDFNENDARVATGFGELAAIALKNSREYDERIRAEEARESLIVELKDALSRVRQLNGLLPICAHCKKVRDDKGYWKQVESYIGEHSEATFSHGICPDCLEKHYPDDE